MTTEIIESQHTSATLEGLRGNHYLRLWRNVPRELGFLLRAMPIAVVGFSVSILLLSVGIGTIVTFFLGAFLLAGLRVDSTGGCLTTSSNSLSGSCALQTCH